jgi:hypothetical protein
MRSLCDSLLTAFPAAAPALMPRRGGTFWIAANLSGPGMALYASAKLGHREQRWQRARKWLGEVVADTREVDDMLDRLSSHAVLVSAGVEGTTSEDARIKLYWQLEEASSLGDLRLPLADIGVIEPFLSEVIESRRIRRAAIVGSIGVRAAGGSVSDVKLDVCAHCVRRAPFEWECVLRRCVDRYGLAQLAMDQSILLKKGELAFVGLGIDSLRKPRLNVYLKRTCSNAGSRSGEARV